MKDVIQNYRNHREEAALALALLRSWGDFPRVPGCSTDIRLGHRIACGRTIEQAAAREYCYRWKLAMRSPTFGVPHTIGM